MAGTEDTANGANRLLKSWKEIAGFFGRDERTVRRWASAMDLPVHRVPGRKRAAVYAYSHDLDRWLRSRAGREAVEESIPLAASTVAESAAPAPRFRRRWPAAGRIAAAACVALVLAAASVAVWQRHSVESRQSAYRPANGAEALYLDGVYNLETRTAGGLTRAISLFTQAIKEDPGYALAHIGLADAYNLVSQYTAVPPGEVYPKARAAAERAIALAPQESGGYAALAFNTYYWQDNFSGSMKLFEQAITLDPDNARAHHWYALVAMQDRRFDLALREIAEAQRLDPKAPAILANKGLILFHAGRIDEALSLLRPLAVTNPSLRSAAAYLATIYMATGRDQDFLREFRRSAQLSGSAQDLAVADAADAGYRDGGRRGMLSAMLAEQQRLHADGKIPAFAVALTAATLGDDRLAFDYLAQSVQRKEPEIKGIRLEPAFLRLRGDQHFKVMVAEAGLSPDDSLQ